MAMRNHNKNKNKTKGNVLSSEELVTTCLKDAPILNSLHPHFVDLVEALEDSFFGNFTIAK